MILSRAGFGMDSNDVEASHVGAAGWHSVCVPGVALAVLVTVPPRNAPRTVATMVKVTVPSGPSVKATPVGGPVPVLGVAVVP